MDQLNETRTDADGQPQHAAPRRPGLLIAMAAAMAMLVVTCAAFFFLLGRGDVRLGSGSAEPSPATSAAFSASATTQPAQATTTTSRPPARRLGFLITMNVGTGEGLGEANRVYLVARDTKPGPGMRIVPVDPQPVDIDPRDYVRRIVHVPLQRILDNSGVHPSPGFTARPNELVEIVVLNRDRVVHSFTFDAVETGKDVYAKKTEVLRFRAPSKPAPPKEPWTFYCRWRMVGMDGVLDIKGPPVTK